MIKAKRRSSATQAASARGPAEDVMSVPGGRAFSALRSAYGSGVGSGVFLTAAHPRRTSDPLQRHAIIFQCGPVASIS